jgi:diguanylate cyclase (GGDEF)-like protein/PAS domain S-box-containing protein
MSSIMPAAVRPGEPTAAAITRGLGRPWSGIHLRRPTLEDLPALGGALAAAVGLTVLIGWVLGSDALRAMFPAGGMMKANTAVCFALAGAGLTVVSRTAPRSRGRSIGLALVGAASAIALASGLQYILHRDLGLDQLLFRDVATGVGAAFPGRMSPVTAVCFALLGCATFLAVAPRARRLVILMASATIVVTVLSFFGYLFNAAAPSFLAGTIQMATNTAVTLGLLGIGVISLLGPASPFVPLADESATAALLKRLLAVSIAVPILTGWLRLEGERLGMWDASYGTSLMVITSVAVIVVVILSSARWADRLEAERAASEIERAGFFELSRDMLSLVGPDGQFRRVNGAWESVLGHRPDELVGRSLTDLVHPDDVEHTLAQSRRHYRHGERVESYENRFQHRDGSYRWLEWTSQTAPDGSVGFSVARDVTDRKRAEDRRARHQRLLQSQNEALSEQADRDPLTGLHNRRHFDSAVARMERRWNRARGDQRPSVSVIIFDLDNFGLVNKQHGHQAGDAVLRLFAGLLCQRFRETDLVARYGGEEFVAVLEGATSSRAMRIAEDVRASFEAASVDIGTGSPLRVTVSAGCAQLGDETDASAGLAMADVWLSQAKRAGRNQVLGL